MSLEQDKNDGIGPLAVLRRIGAAVGRVQSAAHTKKDLIELRRRRRAAFKIKLRDRKTNTADVQAVDPAESETEEY